MLEAFRKLATAPAEGTARAIALSRHRTQPESPAASAALPAHLQPLGYKRTENIAESRRGKPARSM